MKIHTRAFSLIEVILSVAMLSIVAFGVFSAWLYGEEAVVRSGDRNRAVLLASEGADVVRNIRDGDFNTLIDGTYSLQKNNLWWLLVPGDLEKVGPYSRKVTISSVDTTHKKASPEDLAHIKDSTHPTPTPTDTNSLNTTETKTEFLPNTTLPLDAQEPQNQAPQISQDKPTQLAAVKTPEETQKSVLKLLE